MASARYMMKMFGKMSITEQEKFRTMILGIVTPSCSLEDSVKDIRFSYGKVCPKCGCVEHIVRNGKAKNGMQRYVCRDCGKSFVVTSNSVLAGTHKDINTWRTFIDCFLSGDSIRDTAEKCKLHRNTAFAWRHKVLDAICKVLSSEMLDGIIEADETFFPLSYKGNHKYSKGFVMPRPSRHRGSSIHKRGLSREQVCVACAVDRNGKGTAQAITLGRIKTTDLKTVYSGKIKQGATLCTDKMNSYVRFAKAENLNLVQLKTGKAKKGIYHIQHINSYHSELKNFMKDFKGVSTKYLNNYLLWNCIVNVIDGTTLDKAGKLFHMMASTCLTIRVKDVSDRPALPFVV